MTTELYALTIHQAGRLLRRREISSVELTAAVLKRIGLAEKSLHALVTVTSDEAMAQAADADRRLGEGESPALTGVPVVVKDNMCTCGVRTTCSSKML